MRHGCSIFVGNIDFEVPEQKVVEELSAVGKVVHFRLMYDKSTGKSKGYGFCEYESPLIAETAMKTLKITFNGRQVKINYAENDQPNKPKEQGAQPLQIDTIVAAVDSMDRDNLREVLAYLKRMAMDQPSQLKGLLEKHPNLTVTVLTALVNLGMVDPERVSNILNKSFDPERLRDQIAYRVSTLDEADMEGLTEDVRGRIANLKSIINSGNASGSAMARDMAAEADES